ncbi:glycosyltransferase [Vibrio sp. M60_M31a]
MAFRHLVGHRNVKKHAGVYFWAASLLKWKGLETLIKASKRAAISQSVVLNVCYIRPVDTCLPISNAPVLLSHTIWYEDPENLDDIRSQSNIFVSTSCNEPFGLSILEALAAGMCVVIPSDGAYWDKTLTHNENCIKYQPETLILCVMPCSTPVTTNKHFIVAASVR